MLNFDWEKAVSSKHVHVNGGKIKKTKQKKNMYTYTQFQARVYS